MEKRKASGARKAGAKSSRPTIGLLIGRFGDQRYQADIWPGIADVAEERDVNLICFVGRELRSPLGFDVQGNVVYNLVGPENVDGLVALSGTLGHYIGPEGLGHFYERFRPLPIITVSLALKGIPAALVDNRKGMSEAVAHLIDAHGCRRIAFIRGPQGHEEADQRYAAYVETLGNHGLPLDPDLVAPGDFIYPTGVEAIRILLDERKARPDAILAANDETALGVLAALHERGIRVPDDLAVVGFDDVEEARFAAPPLTTARQPLYEQGRKATEMLLTLLAGEPVPEQVVLPTELVVRQSCGCLPQTVLHAAVGPIEGSGSKRAADLAAGRKQIVHALSEAVLPGNLEPGWAGRLFDAFTAELAGGPSGGFLSVLRGLLQQTEALGADVTSLQDVLSILRLHSLPHLAGSGKAARADDLWQQARVLIGGTAEWAQAHRKLQASRRSELLSETSESLMTTFDLEALPDAAARALPQLGIRSCYLSLYENPAGDDPESTAEKSRLILAYTEKGRVELERDGRQFDSRQLVPRGLLPRGRRYTMMLEPLRFRDEAQLGFALFEPAREAQGALIEILTRQIGTALRGALIMQERKQAEDALKQYSERLEEMVEARTGELRDALEKAQLADHLKSEFVANVNHELRTPLTNLLLYYQILRTNPTVKTEERLDVIGRELQRLRRIIEELLDLSRLDQGQAAFFPKLHDLNAIVQTLVDDRRALAEERGLTLMADLHPALPHVWLDEPLIVQAVSNLLTNALNYTPSGGSVHVRTQSGEGAPGSGYVAFSIQDTGPGISDEDLPHLFERFYRGRAGHDTRTPGTGLGLAIVKQVIEKHRGRIEVARGAGNRGAVFTVWLPIQQPG